MMLNKMENKNLGEFPENEKEVNFEEKKNYQRMIAGQLGEKLISYNPGLTKMLHSPIASIFLQQMLYWWKKGHYPDWIWKTIEEMEEETGLTRTQQDTAIKILKDEKCKILKTKLKGVPPIRYFQINFEILSSKIVKFNEEERKKEEKERKKNMLKMDN